MPRIGGAASQPAHLGCEQKSNVGSASRAVSGKARGARDGARVVGIADAVEPQPEDGEVPGWGEPAKDRPSPVFVQAAAIPSATVRVAIGEREIGRVRWSDLEAAAAAGAGALEPAPGSYVRMKG